MAQLDGKQLRDSSVVLDKLTSGLVTFTSAATMSFASGTVLRTDDSNIQVGTDVVNKNYVDAVASGLDPKTPVQAVSATGSITLSGVGFQIDGWTVSAGDRILVNAQAGPNVATSSNGIYSATAGSWTRAEDSDGNPNNEVSHGNFVFVTEGNLYLHSGWVLTTTDAVNPNQILVGTNSQLWVQFSESTNIVDGAGLSYAGQTLNVNTGTGLTISSDNVAIADTTVTAGNYGTAGSVGTFTVNAQGQLVGATSVSININSGQITNFNTDVESVIFDTVKFVDGSTIDFTVLGATGVTAEVMLGSLTASRLDASNSPSNNYVLGYTASGQFYWFDPSSTGDITEITAGNGLTGGGLSGVVTLDVNTDNGLSIVSDNVVLGGTLSQNTTITGGNTYSLGLVSPVTFIQTENMEAYLTVNNNNGYDSAFNGELAVSTNGVYSSIFLDRTRNELKYELSGTGSSLLRMDGVSNTFIDTFNSRGIEYDGDYTSNFVTHSLVTKAYVDSLVTGGDITGITAGDGLSGGGTYGFLTIDVNTGLGLTISSDDVAMVWGGTATGLTFSNNSISANVDGTTIEINTAGQLTVISGISTPVYDRFAGVNTSGDGAIVTGVTLSSTPNDYSRVQVYVNGQLQRLGDGVNTLDCYFGSSPLAINSLTAGDQLYWNGVIAGFNLETTDIVEIIYES